MLKALTLASPALSLDEMGSDRLAPIFPGRSFGFPQTPNWRLTLAEKDDSDREIMAHHNLIFTLKC